MNKGMTAETVPPSRCSQCDAPFVCGADAPSCWCQSLPPLNLSARDAAALATGCLCPSCLRTAIERDAMKIVG